MDFIPYKINEYLENTFYQVPKELFTNPFYKKLNSDSILLYALLLDRLSVSRKNEWIDEDGNVGAIGGVKYKMLGAQKDGADIFFVPKENYDEAKKVYKKNNLSFELVMVETFDEAINYLNNL